MTSRTRGQRLLALIERSGNALPDPAMLFVGLLGIVWLLSALLSLFTFDLIDPRTGAARPHRSVARTSSGNRVPTIKMKKLKKIPSTLSTNYMQIQILRYIDYG